MPVEGCGGLCATRHCFLRSIMHVSSDVAVASILVVNFILVTLKDTLTWFMPPFDTVVAELPALYCGPS